MGYLALEIFDRTGTGSRFASLPEDCTITITETSELFASGDIWSHPFTLNVHANEHIFGSSGDIHGGRLHEQINKRKARLWVMGTPAYLGYLTIGEEAEVDEDGNIDVTLESGTKTFDEMIEGAKANQVPMMSDVQIGMALWRKRWTKCRLKLEASAELRPGDPDYIGYGPVKKDGEEWIDFEFDGENDDNSIQEYPRMVYPCGTFENSVTGESEEFDCINTDSPCDSTHPYCNVALCYQQYGYARKDENGAITYDYSGEPEAQRGYEYMPADRVNSAPNFFVIYWLQALMKHLGINIEENQMTEVEDLRRLFFVNTNCAYREPKRMRTATDHTEYGMYRHSGNIVGEYVKSTRNVDIEGSSFTGGTRRNGELYSDGISVKISKVGEWSASDIADYVAHNYYYHRAYATSECFPNADISDVINAIKNGFGIRLLFTKDYKRVRIVLMRNIFRNTDVQDIQCEIISDSKLENAIRGFRMTYGDNSDNTEFFYKGFDDKLPKKKPYFSDDSDKHDYSRWNLQAKYSNIINMVSAFDRTCFVTPDTGNAYGIKVDKDAKRYEDLHPSLFEFAGYMDAEDGDCTGDEDTIDTVTTGFMPAVMNDLNMESERKGDRKQRFALFVDDAMRPRRVDLKDGEDYNDPEAVYSMTKLYAEDSPAANMKSDGIVKPGEFAIKSDIFVSIDGLTSHISNNFGPVIMHRDLSFDMDGHLYEGYRIYLQDNYEPNDDGVSPIDKHDWGLTLGIMRGSGDDAHVGYEGDPDDMEGNDTWDIIPGSSVTAHPDTCDNYGNEWDYNQTVRVSTPQDAENRIRALYPETADAILDPRRSVTAQEVADAGWSIEGDMERVVDYYYHKQIIYSEEYGKIAVYSSPIAAYSARSYGGPSVYTRQDLETYISNLWTQYSFNLTGHDEFRVIYAVNPSSWSDIAYLRSVYYGYTISRDQDNGLGITDGRLSLKLRAEKPNPYYNPKQPESATNRRYLEITDQNLRGRGLADKLYKDYSYWVRNARIAKRTVRMELAQLLAIDMTVRVKVGDVTGFARKTERTISNKSGIGFATMEIMYI